MLIDARLVRAGSEVRCDLCVVGAGPAGIAIVDRLRGSGLSIILLESGGFDVFNRDIRARGLGAVITPADGWQREIIGGPHHMGTT